MGEVEKGLAQRARAINEEHRAFVGTFRKTVEHGIRAGELLAEAKAECPHGTWLPWLEDNFEGSVRSAQEYMRLYNHRDEIRVKMQDSAHLSVSGALKERASPRRVIPERELAILKGVQVMWEAGRTVHVPILEVLEGVPDEVRRGVVAETAWSALMCCLREYRLARAPLEDEDGRSELTPSGLSLVLREVEAAASILRWWVEQSEGIETQVRACDWPPGRGMPDAAFNPERKHLLLSDLYEDGSEDGFYSPRGFVRELCGPVV
jgi:Protein of unknown function (DUF3102)